MHLLSRKVSGFKKPGFGLPLERAALLKAGQVRSA